MNDDEWGELFPTQPTQPFTNGAIIMSGAWTFFDFFALLPNFFLV